MNRFNGIVFLLLLFSATDGSAQARITSYQELRSINFSYGLDLSGPHAVYTTRIQNANFEFRSSDRVYHLLQLSQTLTLFRRWNSFRWGVVFMPPQHIGELEHYSVSYDNSSSGNIDFPADSLPSRLRISYLHFLITTLFRFDIIKHDNRPVVRLVTGGGVAPQGSLSAILKRHHHMPCIRLPDWMSHLPDVYT